MSVIRFISGGHEVISSLTFSDTPGTVILKAFSINLVGHIQGLILRTADWGWRVQLPSEIGHFVSIDMYSPFVEQPWIHLLSSSLKDIPLNGVYSVT